MKSHKAEIMNYRDF